MGLDYRESVRSRKVLASAVGLFDQVFADSQAAAADLVECGYSQVTVLPNLHVPRSFDVIQSYPSSPFLSFHEPNSTLMLIHAPITPNQRIEDAIRLLSWYCRFIDSKADLVVLGRPIPSDYFLILKDLIHSLSIQSHVHFIRDLHPDGIKACYESADVFLSLAESDCPRFEPLEVSFFDTPSICFDHPDVREVLGDAGLYINRRDIPALSELVALIINQNKFRESIVKKQKERYFSFLKKSSIHELGACLLGS
jgi:glycosyltransferase involved in cell wall biosynthesis